MKQIQKYITSVHIQHLQAKFMNITLGFEGNGSIRLYYGDTSELDQHSNYFNEELFPNSGFISGGMYSMWSSIYSNYKTRSTSGVKAT